MASRSRSARLRDVREAGEADQAVGRHRQAQALGAQAAGEAPQGAWGRTHDTTGQYSFDRG